VLAAAARVAVSVVTRAAAAAGLDFNAGSTRAAASCAAGAGAAAGAFVSWLAPAGFTGVAALAACGAALATREEVCARVAGAL
jgi:hypothetical protein